MCQEQTLALEKCAWVSAAHRLRRERTGGDQRSPAKERCHGPHKAGRAELVRRRLAWACVPSAMVCAPALRAHTLLHSLLCDGSQPDRGTRPTAKECPGQMTGVSTLPMFSRLVDMWPPCSDVFTNSRRKAESRQGHGTRVCFQMQDCPGSAPAALQKKWEQRMNANERSQSDACSPGAPV